MKKYVALFMVLAMVFSFSGCSSDNGSSSIKDDKEVSSTDTALDGSISDMDKTADEKEVAAASVDVPDATDAPSVEEPVKETPTEKPAESNHNSGNSQNSNNTN